MVLQKKQIYMIDQNGKFNKKNQSYIDKINKN